ncbi:unnamed protein product [Amoebophrya sp. A120]|nr:unnamed protein product [Amoebophrya sp. A120]|eukprot:GSA120T00014351001.1
MKIRQIMIIYKPQEVVVLVRSSSCGSTTCHPRCSRNGQEVCTTSDHLRYIICFIS